MAAHLIAWVTLAWAVDPSAYTGRAAVELAPQGVVVAQLPADVVAGGADGLERTMALLDGGGRAVPYTVVLAPRPADAAFLMPHEALEDGRWHISAADRPIEGLVLGFDGTEPLVAEVDGAHGRVRELVWQRSDGSVPTVRFPPAPGAADPSAARSSPGPFTVRLSTLSDGAVVPLRAVQGVPVRPDVVAPAEETLPVTAPSVLENGRARWVVRLPGPREVREVRLEVAGDIFERRVWIAGATEGIHDFSEEWGIVRRVMVGDTRIDAARLFGLALRDDTLVIEAETARGAPLPITAVTVVSTGAALVARDVGAGPHALLVDGPADADAFDLAAGVDALLQGPHATGRVQPPGPNPEYVPAATRGGVDAPGTVIDVHRWRYARPLNGRGWSSVRLDGRVLARATEQDLRVVDGEGRQVPYLLRTSLADALVTLGAPRREEVGSVTLLHVPVPDPDAPLRSLFLRAEGGAFSRSVSILVDRGGMSETVRSVVWDATAQGSAVRIDVDRVIGAALVVRIENGDDPPLGIVGVEATGPVWELRANLPEGARLLYGNAHAQAPQYDVTLLAEPMLRARLAAAEVGQEVVNRAERSAADVVATWAGMAVIVVGLAGMAVRVARAAPEVETGPAEG